MRIVLEAGNLESTLVAQRDAIDAKIRQLRGQRSGTAPEKA
jgi:hypothetical protein